MRTILTVLFVILVTLSVSSEMYAQAETVPADHPVYVFLKRMDVRGFLYRYRDAVIPLSRRDIATHLLNLKNQQGELTSAEQSYVEDFLSEFRYDALRTTEGFHSIIGTTDSERAVDLTQLFSTREKYLYTYADSSISIFVNGLATIDVRRISGDALGSTRSEYFQFGGRFRGTLFDKLGFYLQGTNAQFWGSRDLLIRDRVVGQTHTIFATDARNFDIAEGYVRYDGGLVSAQIGRERLLWGRGYDQKMIVSENSRVFDFVRADLEFKSLKYTFMHGWLLGRRSTITFTLPTDTSAVYYEPVIADKYVAAHRIEFSFPRVFDFGFQEVAIYSNRSVDLAYLNPFIVIESAQRARGERDNVAWAFDIQTHFVRGMEFSALVFFDDLHLGEFFSNKWYNRYAYQLGIFLTDPWIFPNTSLMIEYTRVEPYVFAHDRSRENDFSNHDALLGPRIGPNADSWFFRMDYLPHRNLNFSARVTLSRHGRNITDPNGTLIKNVGGDFRQGHRSIDPVEKIFLDGQLFKTRRIQFSGTFEFVHQMWLEAWYQFESETDVLNNSKRADHTFGSRIRWEI